MKLLAQVGGWLAVGVIALALGGCSSAESSDDENGAADEEVGSSEDALHLVAGANGGSCYLSPYNCKFRVTGGNRIQTPTGDLDWPVDRGANVLDGNGDVLGVNNISKLRFNYGQRRSFGGKTYVYAMATSNSSSGWFPLASVQSHDLLASRVGDVPAHRAGLKTLGCYEVRNAMDDTLAAKKVVKNTEAKPGPVGDAAGDYLPRLRANGKRSVNLVFNTPGSALGGPAIDHFPPGTKFQRLDVPTDSHLPSIDVPLWLQDAGGHFTKPAGSMKFIYGTITTKTGEVRTGWIPFEALSVSSGCK